MAAVIIEPTRQKGEPELVGPGLLVVNPGEAGEGHRLARDAGGRRHFLYNSTMFQIPANHGHGPWFLAGPAVGAPMAVMVLEKLIALGAGQVIVSGWCGALTSGLAVGDIVLPTWAVSEEGTSAHYPGTGRPRSDPGLRARIAAHLAGHGLSWTEGPLWTTDAPYRETVDKVAGYAGQGILGIEMEFSALAAVAAFRGISLAAVLLVSDELWRHPWRPGFRRPEFKEKSRLVRGVLVDFVRIPRRPTRDGE